MAEIKNVILKEDYGQQKRGLVKLKNRSTEISNIKHRLKNEWKEQNRAYVIYGTRSKIQQTYNWSQEIENKELGVEAIFKEMTATNCLMTMTDERHQLIDPESQ